ncbi:ATP-binding cassette domain-containing protein [Streptomyces reniochalinae]|uniref:ATP-binding cassette domain-containing protein n=1 Tax=Streptomyces reniochalinae TaxID=2250578 RepID=A0A367E6H4_9ACTN|nr:ATP-binding cassette domain-containing protein [Streptomyces reniochalinae]
MIQAIGLTSTARRKRQPQVDDLTFEARSGEVTVLLGPTGSGKSEALRLMLQLLPGRGVALFRGRPVQRIPHPAREIGVLLGDVPGHPARTARGHLRMLTAVAGVPVERADEVLEVVGLSGLADQRLGDFSLGMDRRLGMAAALLGDPHTLVLDQPTQGLSLREASWLQGLLRSYAEHGGLVLVTARDPKEAARIADRVVSINGGRLVADQQAADFSRTRLRPRVAVRTPHAERFAAVLSQEARSGERTRKGRGAVEVVCEGGSRVSVYGSDCAAVGELAHRHGILVHQLKDEIGDTGDGSRPSVLDRADGRASDALRPTGQETEATAGEQAEEGADDGRKRQSVESGWGDGPHAAVRGEGTSAAGAQPAAPGHAAVPAPHTYVPGRGGTGTPGATVESADQDCSGVGADGTGSASSGVGVGAEGELDPAAGEGGPERPASREARAEAAQEPTDSDRASGEGALVPAASDDTGAADTPDERRGQQRRPVGRAATSTPRGNHGRLAENDLRSANSGEEREPVSGQPDEAENAGPHEALPVCVSPDDRVSDNGGTRTEERPPAARSTPVSADVPGRTAPSTHSDNGTSARAVAPHPTSSSPASVRSAVVGAASVYGAPADAARGGDTARAGRQVADAPWTAKVVASARDRLRTRRNGEEVSASAGAREAAGRGGTTTGGGEITAATFPVSPVVRRSGPVAPVQYELRRLFGVRTPWVVVALTLLAGLAISLTVVRAGAGGTVDAATGIAPGMKLLMGWPPGSPFMVPPAAVAAGFLGATAFGQEFRYPALVPAQVPVPRRLGLLVAKLVVTAGAAVGLCAATALCNAAVLTLFFGPDSGVLAFPGRTLELAGLTRLSVPGGDGTGHMVPSLGVQVLAVLVLCVGCAWAGLLAAGVCRSTMAGLIAVGAVPSLVAPLVARAAVGADGQSVDGMPERLRSVLLFPWPSTIEQWGSVAGEIATQPVGRALALSLTVLFGAYGITSLRGRPRRQ